MNSVQKIFLLFLALNLPCIGYSQQLLLSPDEYIDGNNGTVKILGNIGDTTVSFVESTAGFELIWHDSIMRKLGTTSLDFLERGSEEIRLYTSADAAYVFFQKKKRKIVQLWAARVPPVHKDTVYPQLIDSVELSGVWDKSRFVMHNTGFPNRFAYTFSQYSDRDNKLNFRAVLLNEYLTPLQITSDEVNDVVQHVIIQVRTDGMDGIHVLFGEPTNSGKRLQHIVMGSKRVDQPILSYQKLELQGYQIDGLEILYDKASKNIVVGSLLFPPTSNVLSALGKFSYNALTQSWNPSIITTIGTSLGLKQTNLSDVFLRKILTRADGGSVFVLEKAYEEIYQRNRSIGFVTPGLGMASSSYSIYHTNEIFVLNTSPLGNIDWYEVIEKSQETSDANERFQSFATLEYPSGTVFLYNDQSGQTRRFITAYLSNAGKLTLRQFNSSAFPDIEDAGLLLRSAKQVGTDEIVFPMVQRRALTFAKIKF